jgi:hypothetical protein
MKPAYSIARIALAACTARPAVHELATSIAKGLVGVPRGIRPIAVALGGALEAASMDAHRG